MILVGNQRGGARELALHLLKEENEHVEVHEIRGFASQNLAGALKEAYAISRATKCRLYLFSLSLNPPPDENVPIADFEDAIARIEKRLGLSGQPRAIVFHEKEGRRHCHAVWSRINTEKMKAVPLPYSKRKLQDIARELYLEHGWTMPRGFATSQESDPRNFSLAEWQQAKRTGKDPRTIKAAFQDAWAISDSKAAFINALEERGYRIARGDRRGFVALDYQGEVYAIAKWAGIKTKQVRDRLGDGSDLPNASEVKNRIAQDMLPVVTGFQETLEAKEQDGRVRFENKRQELIAQQRAERQMLSKQQVKRNQLETEVRQKRFRTGVRGLWDRLSGRYKRIKAQNEQETYQAFQRDRAEKEQMIFTHLAQRRCIEADLFSERQDYRNQEQEIRQDLELYNGMLSKLRNERLQEFSKERQSRDVSNTPKTHHRGRSLER